MKLPVKAAAIGLLLAILFAVTIGPETVEGTAVLMLVVILTTATFGWALEIISRRKNK